MNEAEKFFGGVNRGIAFIKGLFTFILVLLLGSFFSEDLFGNLWGFFALFGGIGLIIGIVQVADRHKNG